VVQGYEIAMKRWPRAGILWHGRDEHYCSGKGDEERKGQRHGRERTENEQNSFHGC
jgi:hypothetical protein